MEEKIVKYGDRRKVTVESASKEVIICVDKSINEGFILMYHGMDWLPGIGEEGVIIFERDDRQGHWQYHRIIKAV